MNFASRTALAFFILFSAAVMPVLAVPPHIFGVNDLEKAVVEAWRLEKPLVVVVYSAPRSKNAKNDRSGHSKFTLEIFNSFNEVGVVVAIEFFDMGDPCNDFLAPMGDYSPNGFWGLNGDKAPEQRTPHVWVTTVDGSKNIQSIPSNELERDLPRVIKKLQRKLRKADIYEGAKPPLRAPATTGEAPVRMEWFNSRGVKISGTFRSIIGKRITFIKTNGEEVSYSLENLAAVSRKQAELLREAE